MNYLLDAKSDEASVEFGMAITGKAGVLLAQVGVEAAYKVTLTRKTADS